MGKVGKDEKNVSHFENSMAASYKIKQTHFILPSKQPYSYIFTREKWSMGPKTCMFFMAD